MISAEEEARKQPAPLGACALLPLAAAAAARSLLVLAMHERGQRRACAARGPCARSRKNSKKQGGWVGVISNARSHRQEAGWVGGLGPTPTP